MLAQIGVSKFFFKSLNQIILQSLYMWTLISAFILKDEMLQYAFSKYFKKVQTIKRLKIQLSG